MIKRPFAHGCGYSLRVVRVEVCLPVGFRVVRRIKNDCSDRSKFHGRRISEYSRPIAAADADMTQSVGQFGEVVCKR
jgi:hypothetical protein